MLWSVDPGSGSGKMLSVSTDKHPLQATKVAWRGGAQAPHILASGGKKGLVKIWDTRHFGSASMNISTVREVQDLQFDPYREHQLVAGTDGGRVLVFDLRMQSRQARSEFEGGPSLSSRAVNDFCAHNGSLYSLAWHPCVPGVLATSGRDYQVKVWGMWGQAQSEGSVHLSWDALTPEDTGSGPGQPRAGREPRLISSVKVSVPVSRVAWRPGVHHHLATCYNVISRVHVWDITRPKLPVGLFEAGGSVEDVLWMGHHSFPKGVSPTPGLKAAREAAFLHLPPKPDLRVRDSRPAFQAGVEEEHRGTDSEEEGTQGGWLLGAGHNTIEDYSPRGSPRHAASAPTSPSHSPLRMPVAAGLFAHEFESRVGDEGPEAIEERPHVRGRPRPGPPQPHAADHRPLNQDEDCREQAGDDDVTFQDAWPTSMAAQQSRTATLAPRPLSMGVQDSESRHDDPRALMYEGAASGAQVMRGIPDVDPPDRGAYSFGVQLIRERLPLITACSDGHLRMHFAAFAYQPHQAVSTCALSPGPHGVAWLAEPLHRDSAWPRQPQPDVSRRFPPPEPVKPLNVLTTIRLPPSMGIRSCPGDSSNSVFSQLASGYKMHGYHGSIVMLCLHNAGVAESAGVPDLQHLWLVIAVLCVDLGPAVPRAALAWLEANSATLRSMSPNRMARGAEAKHTAAPQTLPLDEALLSLGNSLHDVVSALEADLQAEAGAATRASSPQTGSAERPAPATAPPTLAAPAGPSTTRLWLRDLRRAFLREVFDFFSLHGELQTCTVIARVLLHDFAAFQTDLTAKQSPVLMTGLPDIGVGLKRLGSWEGAYIDLLHRHRLWGPASTVMARSVNPGIKGMNMTGTSVSLLRCGPDKRLELPSALLPELVARANVHPVLLPGAPPRQAGLGSHSGSSAAVQTEGVVHIEQLGFSELAKRNPRAAAEVCAVCHEAVWGLFIQCHYCGTGGHATCLKRWFEHNTHSPGGGHACVRGGGLRTLQHEPKPRPTTPAAGSSRVEHTFHGFECLLDD